ncbi:PaaI family thioesterase [Bradyrhizobium sp. CCBAU 53421]|uniref:PaaI family thioesterase n=1 Tax=Bradyrhizobium sp. CCBAU 53421 TaxID=1325120 RepID=UPI00188C2077|nr:PaaI family thioesterase [Bradyrhizobium sp. CCBAU 53421]QOZ36405.1 PaaI family thioesterase [Bradyrhizobium sp. CCBAU 53421]
MTSDNSNVHGSACGEFSGWRTSVHTPYEIHSGPFWYRQEPGGSVRSAFRVEKKHCNDSGNVHGGCLMTFADFCLSVATLPVLEGQAPTTINFSGSFIDAAQEGDLIMGNCEITRAGRSLIFVQGRLTTNERILFTFSGTVKRGQKKSVAQSSS